MTGPDPWSVLGLQAGSSVAEARTARRQLAKRLHPDLYDGDSCEERAERSARMTLVNRALADIEAVAPSAGAAGAAGGRPSEPDDPRPTAEPIDGESFAVACLPAEAFEALFLVAYGLGDVLSTDEPYRLELYLTEPEPCFCQLTLVPEAGGSLVLLDVEPPGEAAAAPSPASVRDVLVAELNRLARGR